MPSHIKQFVPGDLVRIDLNGNVALEEHMGTLHTWVHFPAKSLVFVLSTYAPDSDNLHGEPVTWYNRVMLLGGSVIGIVKSEWLEFP